jgi:hypothetical protein
MADVGSQEDCFERLRANLARWFGTVSPNLDALLQGTAETDSTNYSQITYSNQQTRIATATGDALDLISKDYFGYQLPRHHDENDASYKNRIYANLIQELATRNGMITVLTKLTGNVPTVIEGWNTLDIGAYDQSLYYDIYGGLGLIEPYTAVIYVTSPQPEGFVYIGGYDQTEWGGFGYDFNFNNAYIDSSEEIIEVSNKDIFEAVERTKVYGTHIYLYIDGFPYP